MNLHLQQATSSILSSMRAQTARRLSKVIDMPKGTEKKKTNNKPKLTVKEKKEKKKTKKS